MTILTLRALLMQKWIKTKSKVGIITIALWSPNLIQNHNKKVFHTSFEIHLFLGNVPPLQCITELPDDSNSQKKTNIIFSGQKLIKMFNLYQKMVEPHHFTMSFKYSNPGAYITYLMLLYLPWSACSVYNPVQCSFNSFDVSILNKPKLAFYADF